MRKCGCILIAAEFDAQDERTAVTGKQPVPYFAHNRVVVGDQDRGI